MSAPPTSKSKAARLVVGERVAWLPEPDVRSQLADLFGQPDRPTIAYRFRVEGDHAPYECWAKAIVQDGRLVFWATCSRGGDHDFTPAQAACSHMLAAAVELARTVRPELGRLLATQEVA